MSIPSAVRYEHPLRGGVTQPHVILFNDGNKYVVKFKNNRACGRKALISEFIVSKFAKIVKFSIKDGQIVQVGKTLCSVPQLQNLEFGLQLVVLR